MDNAERLADLLRGMLPAEGSAAELPIRIRLWDGSTAGPVDAPTVSISRRALRRLVWSPNELGISQAYVTGELDVEGGAKAIDEGLRRLWARAAHGSKSTLSTSDKVEAVRTAYRLGALALKPSPPATQAVVKGRLHTKSRDREVIAHHYDLSNDFYELILDESMAYSCAFYRSEGDSVAAAQRAKLDLICRKLGLRPGMRLLDVGCGWGSLSLHAAKYFGAQVIGVTISKEQRAFATARAERLGVSDQVDIRVQDYRDVAEEPFDAVSSIEMGEHVGDINYPTYAATLHKHLKPGGRLLLQQMSRAGDAAPGGGPFIEGFIAPDMSMRPLPDTLRFLQAAGLEIREVQGMREHYARTINDWADTFESNYERAVELVGEETARVWRLYLIGSAMSFEQGRMGVDQILAQRPYDDGVLQMPVPDWHETT